MSTFLKPKLSNPEHPRCEFPALDQQVHGKPLVYLDNAATTQKPRSVLGAMQSYYEHDNANVHRGVHALSQRATEAFDESRRVLQRFVNAASEKEIIFTKGCTEAINLVAHSWGRTELKPGDRILLSHMEHHANIVPWQIAAEMTGAEIHPIPITDEGEIDLGAFERLLDERVKLVGVKHVCNALGTINPVAKMIEMAHQVGAKALVDGAQATAHIPVDVRDLDVDFYTISGHKLYGPTGVGALYAKEDLLERMPPYQSGGDMIRTVTFEKTTYNDLPNKFEAGTPNMAGAIGLAAAADFLRGQGWDEIENNEQRVLSYATDEIGSVPGVRIIGTAKHKAAIVSFVMEGVHPHDIGTIVDGEGVAIRTGHHCCMPLMQRLGIPATARASFAIYNSKSDVDSLVSALQKVREILT